MRTAVFYFYVYEVCFKSDQFSKKSNREWIRNPTLSDIMVRYMRSLY